MTKEVKPTKPTKDKTTNSSKSVVVKTETPTIANTKEVVSTIVELQEVPVIEEAVEVGPSDAEVLQVEEAIINAITYEVETLEGGMLNVKFSDGSNAIMTQSEVQNLGNPTPKSNPIPVKVLSEDERKEKEVMEHYASLGQVDYYLKHIKK